MNPRPPSATPFNAVAFQPPAIYAERPDVALYAISPLFLLPTSSSPHCTLKVSEHDSLLQPPAAQSDERPRPQESSRAERCLNTLTPGYLKSPVVRGHPMVWSLAPCHDGAKQDPVVYGAEFGLVFLAKGSTCLAKTHATRTFPHLF